MGRMVAGGPLVVVVALVVFGTLKEDSSRYSV